MKRNPRASFRSLVLHLVALTPFLSACRPSGEEVVVYSALDRGFAEPLFKRFEQEFGIRVRAVYDVESTKTIGLVNRLRSESGRPRCDVFWNNEIVNTIAIAREGLLTEGDPPSHLAGFPSAYQDSSGVWYGFAARARVLLINTELVDANDRPSSLSALLEPQWIGRVAIAKPLFGTTATHVAWLRAKWGANGLDEFLTGLRQNKVQIHAGNKGVARAVSAGRAAVGLTDTDDALIEVEAGHPVVIVLPGPPLLIPNTLARVKGGPNPEAAAALIDFLLSPRTEEFLAAGPSAQIPLHRDAAPSDRLPPIPLDLLQGAEFERAADQFEAALRQVEAVLLAP